MIALPTFSPFAFLGAALVRNGWITLVVALMVVGGWARVVYIDTRPYEGGGATFSFLLGWAACTLAFLMAVLLAIEWDARRRSTEPRARSVDVRGKGASFCARPGSRGGGLGRAGGPETRRVG